MRDAVDAGFDAELRLSRRRFIGGTTALATAVATPIFAQQFFDVPFVPTPQVVVDEMLRLAAVGPKDVVYDLGSGDGRIVISAASKFGARAVGVELNEHLIYQSEESARQANVESRVKFLQQDFFKTDFSEASVVTLYLLPAVMKRLRERMLQLKPGTRLVAHDFDFEDWRPDVKTTIRKNAFLWIVPARAGGQWQTRVELAREPFAFAMDVRQKYQEIDGIVKMEGSPPGGLWEAKLVGDRIRFIVVDSRDRDREASLYFDGRVSGDTMRGEGVRGVGSALTRFTWHATRQR
jgi:SAM-dependent methyltransferase